MQTDWAAVGSPDDSEYDPLLDDGAPGGETEGDDVEAGGGQAEVGEAAVDETVPAASEPLSPEDALAHIERSLDEVEEALTRLDDGTYGQCASCGSVIDDGILVVLPTAQACSSCASVNS